MTTHTEKQKIQVTITEFQTHLANWQHGVDRLAGEVKQLKKDIQPKYEKQIADLRQQLNQLEGRLAVMKSDVASVSGNNWADAQVALINFAQAFDRTAYQIRDEEQIPLGWLQGFTDARTHESEGWAEGMGRQPQGSEGWAEGMGKQPTESEGWAEGMKQQQ